GSGRALQHAAKYCDERSRLLVHRSSELPCKQRNRWSALRVLKTSVSLTHGLARTARTHRAGFGVQLQQREPECPDLLQRHASNQRDPALRDGRHHRCGHFLYNERIGESRPPVDTASQRRVTHTFTSRSQSSRIPNHATNCRSSKPHSAAPFAKC